MTVSVCMLSRKHPEALTGVIMGLWRLRSTQHQINFYIGADFDDQETQEAFERLANEIPSDHLALSVGERPKARGEVENRLLSHGEEAKPDVVTLLTDRTFCITPHWDDVLMRGAAEKPTRPLWWSSPQDNVCAIPIMPKAYMEANDWKWSPEIFPFWFDDTWHQHIDLMINGIPSLKVKANFAGLRGKTTRGRDFGFWIDCFYKLLPIRVEQAKSIARRLNQEFIPRPDVMQYMQSWYDTMMRGVEGITQAFGDPNEPGPEYLAAKARAEKMLAEMLAMDLGAKNVA